MASTQTTKVTVIGAGIVGMACASYLQRDGHEVAVLDPVPPGESCSFGNAGGISPGAVVPLSMPGMLSQVPKWLLDPMGPLAVRPAYLPRLVPWLVRFWRAGSARRVEHISIALRALHRQTFECYDPAGQGSADRGPDPPRRPAPRLPVGGVISQGRPGVGVAPHSRRPVRGTRR